MKRRTLAIHKLLIDTTVWVDHFRHGNNILTDLLTLDLVLTHPMVLDELACGTPPSRVKTLQDIGLLQPAQQASMREVLAFVEREKLYGLGYGLVDMVLLTSTLMTLGAQLWTLAKKLATLAARFGVLRRAGLH